MTPPDRWTALEEAARKVVHVATDWKWERGPYPQHQGVSAVINGHRVCDLTDSFHMLTGDRWTEVELGQFIALCDPATIQELIADARAGKRTESGWVIEGAWSSVSTPEYYIGLATVFSGDHMKALRFSRKADAEFFAANMLNGINVRICEHEWECPLRTTQGDQT